MIDEPPPAVRQLLHANQRQAAIDLLSENLANDQKEAERRIDQYLEDDPPVHMRGPAVVRASRLNALAWLILIVLMALLALIFAL